MENDIDIYEDLPSFEAIETDGCGQRNEELASECEELKKHVTELLLKLENFQKVNKNLEVNLSSLLKTAKAEIARKDKTIEELRKRLDDASFRKGHFSRATVVTARAPPQQSLVRHTPFSQDLEYIANFGTEEFSSGDRNGRASRVKPDRAPTTVFSERLRRRIAEEDGIDAKEKGERKFDVKDDLGNLCQDRVAESDKENGARRNIVNKENQSRCGSRLNRADNVALHEKDVSFPNILDPLYREIEVHSFARHEAIANRRNSGKREADDTIDVSNVKRTKVCDGKETSVEEESNVERRNVSVDRVKLNQKGDRAQVSKNHYEAERSNVEEEYHYLEKKQYQCGDDASTKDEDINSRNPSGGSHGREKDASRDVAWNDKSVTKRKYMGRESAEWFSNGRHPYDRKDGHHRNHSPARFDRYRIRQRDNRDKERVGQWPERKSLEAGYAPRNHGRVKNVTQSGSRDRNEDRRRVSRTRDLYDLHGKSKRSTNSRNDAAEPSVSKDRKYGNEKSRCERLCPLDAEAASAEAKFYTVSKTRSFPGDERSCRKSEERYDRNAKTSVAEDLPEERLAKRAEGGEEACIRSNGLHPSEPAELPDAPNSNSKDDQKAELEIGSNAAEESPTEGTIPQDGISKSSIDVPEVAANGGRGLDEYRPNLEETPSTMAAASRLEKSYNEGAGAADTRSQPDEPIRGSEGLGPTVEGREGGEDAGRSGGRSRGRGRGLVVAAEGPETAPESQAVVEDAEEPSREASNRVSSAKGPARGSSGERVIEPIARTSPDFESDALVARTSGAVDGESSRNGKMWPWLVGCAARQDPTTEEKDSASGMIASSVEERTDVILESLESGGGGAAPEVDASGGNRASSNETDDSPVETGSREKEKGEEEEGDWFDSGLPKRESLKEEIVELADRQEEPDVKRNGHIKDTARLKIESEVDDRTHGRDREIKPKTTSVAASTDIGCDAPTEEQAKVIVLARRRKPVRLADSNANMTILVNSNKTCFVTADQSTFADHDNSPLKPRACKLQRSYKNGR
ncbi:hypothetical protein KM043_001567 [Ampulex compressa]|nr:hypothetical protein KM043_001567 [Ampulex compressa]